MPRLKPVYSNRDSFLWHSVDHVMQRIPARDSVISVDGCERANRDERERKRIDGANSKILGAYRRVVTYCTITASVCCHSRGTQNLH